MSGYDGPENARTDSQSLRWYRWEPEGQEPTDVLSVTSLRRACGVGNNLVSWMTSNLINAACGTRRVERIGPRGGVRTAYEPDGQFPGEFTRLLLETEGAEAKLAQVRSWLREAAETPRDVAAMRGSITHRAIEVSELEPSDEWLTQAFKDEGASRKRRTPLLVRPDDLMFVRRTLGQYIHWAAENPFQIMAREPQVWNLELGYAGSLDVLGQFQKRDEDEDLVVLDYKTATDIHTDNLLQVMGYMAAQFVGANGVVDEALSALLPRITHGGLLHLRPDGWSLHLFPFRPEIMQAFVGMVMLARFTADYPEPKHLFATTRSGRAPQ